MLFLDLFANGLLIGLFYAMMAIGLCLIFGILRVVNFAHGEFYTVGTYIYTFVAVSLGISVWIALPIAMLTGALLGWLTERLLMRPLYAGYTSWANLNLRHEYAVIVTFGLSLLLINLIEKVFGPFNFFGPNLVNAPRIFIGPVIMTGHRLLAAIIAIFVLTAVVLAVRYTYWGKQIQAVSQNRFGATLAGIDTSTVSGIVFALAGGLAAFAGALLSPLVLAEPMIGVFPAIKSFVVIVIGGMGSIPGAIIGGLLLGVFENFAAVYIASEYRDAFGMMLLIAVLVIRPHGLFGEQGREI
jgi:branched-chain amino acid transport system permease protein